MPRGQTFSTSSSDAIMPTQQIAISMCGPLENHSSVGANQKRDRPELLRHRFADIRRREEFLPAPISPRI